MSVFRTQRKKKFQRCRVINRVTHHRVWGKRRIEKKLELGTEASGDLCHVQSTNGAEAVDSDDQSRSGGVMSACIWLVGDYFAKGKRRGCRGTGGYFL